VDESGIDKAEGEVENGVEGEEENKEGLERR
jgi:hypothetical protein